MSTVTLNHKVVTVKFNKQTRKGYYETREMALDAFFAECKKAKSLSDDSGILN